MTSARQIYLGSRRGPALPYDSEVEYLESTGTQWIDLGFKGTNLFTCDIGLYRETTSPRWDFGAYSPMGVDSGMKDACGGFLERGAWMYLYVIDGMGMTWENADVSKSPWLGDIQLIVSRNATTWLITRTIKAGSLIASKSNYAQEFVTAHNLCLFKKGPSATPNAQTAGMRLKYCKIEDGSNVRDMVPVRFTNEQGVSEGAMYDRVSGQLFRNSGTGAFNYGNDK